MSRTISGAFHPIGRTSSPLYRHCLRRTVLSAYASANVTASTKDARAPILRREAEKHKRYDASLAVIGPGLKLLAFGMNHIGVLGDNAKKVISEQATVLFLQGTCSQSTASRILRTHLSIAFHSFNSLSGNVRKRILVR